MSGQSMAGAGKQESDARSPGAGQSGAAGSSSTGAQGGVMAMTGGAGSSIGAQAGTPAAPPQSAGAGSGAGGAKAECVSGCATGDTCQADAQCSSGRCRMAQCRAREAVGGSCVTNADCQAALQCQSAVCKRNLGGSCGTDDECVEGSCLRATCTAAQPLGSVCQSNRGCVTPNDCSAGVCHVPLGGSCSSADQCGPNVCLGNVCAKQPASNSAGMGQPCNADSQCISGSCGWQDICAARVGPTINCNSDADCISPRRCTNMSAPGDTGYCCDSTPNDGC